MRIDVYEDKHSYVTDEVSTVPTCEANLNEENRMKFVTDLAAVSRGKGESKNPAVRYGKLLAEAAPTNRQIKDVMNDKNSRGQAFSRIFKDIVGSPSRPLEFLPVKMLFVENGVYEVFDMKGNYLWEFASICEVQMLLKYSYLTYLPFGKENGHLNKLSDKIVYVLHTNMRALINAGVPYEKIPYNSADDLNDFKALKAMIPMFVWAQVPNTHTAISKEAQSDRVSGNQYYWLPNDLREMVYEYKQKHAFEFKDVAAQELLSNEGKQLEGTYPKPIYQKLTDEILACSNRDMIPEILIGGREATSCMPTQLDVQNYFKELGYHQEIYSRAMYYFKYKEVVMTGWYTDPNVWSHLFLERNAMPDIWKNWTQKQSKVFVEAIKKIIGA